MNPVLDTPGRRRKASSAKHKYFVCLSYNQEPLPWDLDDETQDFAPAYLQKALRAMKEELDAPEGLTFYITWRLDELPSYGEDVVAVVMGDEWSRIPRYTHRVRATFKCYGIRPSLGCNPLRHPSYLNMLLAIKLGRTGVHYAPGAADYAWQRARHALTGSTPYPPVFDLPLGYGNQLELPIKPITERGFDLFFAGSVTHDTYPVWSPKFWLQSPKTVSRSQMMRTVEDLQRQDASLKVQLATTSSFALNAIYYGTADADVLDAARYSEAMMNTKICLVPRGTSPETFRFFEAMRYGCVLVTEKLPSRWFYDGSPAIELEDWSELAGVVARLRGDEALLRRKHREALDWWRRVCSERAVGVFMASKLNALVPDACV